MPNSGNRCDIETHIETVSPADYPIWVSSNFAEKMLFIWNIPSYVIGLWTFLLYWGVPLIFSILAGTVLPKDTLKKWANESNDIFSLAPLFQYFEQHQVLVQENSICYFTDYTHFTFAVIIAIGSGLAAHIVRRFHLLFLELRKRRIPIGNEKDFIVLYRTYNNLLNHQAFKIISLLLAVLVSMIFFHLSSLDKNQHWWGYKDYGNAGLSLSIVEGFMVYWGSNTMVVLGVGSLLLARLMSYPLKLRPFHSDGCNGLAPLGYQIVLLWLFALALAMAIYVTLKFGYLGIESTFVVWVIAALGTITIPTLAILPLMASLKSIQEARLDRLAGFEYLLEDLLDKTLDAVKSGHCEDALKSVGQMNGIQSAHEVINAANVWPFNPKALAGILLVNVIQVIFTAHELINLLTK